MKVLMISSASVSVPISAKVHRRLLDDGHVVMQFLTQNAKTLWVGSGKFDDITDLMILDGSFKDECDRHFQDGKGIIHIEFVDTHDVCVVCPADFNIVGKMANGIADDVASSTLAAWIGSGKPLYIAEAMNTMMYQNPIHLANVWKLDKLPQVKFICPTVKKLACGSYGIGGLADANAIADIVEGHSWVQPIKTKDLIGVTKRVFLHPLPRNYYGNPGPCVDVTKDDFSFRDYLPKFNEPGAFGAERKYDRHEGVDIYCKYGSEVYAVEDGEVVDSYQYTGSEETGAWWNPTWCLKVKGRSGVVTYGELQMPDECLSYPKIVSKPNEKLKFGEVKYKYPEVGTLVKAGDHIGYVGKVLPDEKRRDDIRNHNNCMLHMELRTENCHLDGWELGAERNKKLLDPSPYLHLID